MSLSAPPLDPLAWLENHGVRVLPEREGDGVRLVYCEPLAGPKRRKAERIRVVFGRLLRLQIQGERPRSVRKLMATGRIRLVGGRYVLG